MAPRGGGTGGGGSTTRTPLRRRRGDAGGGDTGGGSAGTARFVDGGHRGQRRHGPARRAIQVRRRSHLAWHSTARVSPSTHGVRPACTCRTNPAAQYASIPHVTQSEIQPGDLVFYKIADRPRRHLHRRRLDDPRAAHRRRRQGRCGQLGQGRRNRSTRLSHRYGVALCRASISVGSAAWLDANIAGAQSPFEFALIAGGRSNLTYAVTDGDGQRFVLRRPPLAPGAGHGPRHGPRAPHHLGGRPHRRAGAAGARTVHRRRRSTARRST